MGREEGGGFRMGNTRGDIPLVELCVEPAGFSGRCTGVLVTLLWCLHPQGCLRSGVRASGSYPDWTAPSGSFGMRHHPRGYVSNFLMTFAMGGVPHAGPHEIHYLID